MDPTRLAGLRQQLLADEKVKEKIAARAYQLFENRGQEHGHSLEDWHQAEEEILTELIAQEQILRTRRAAGGSRSRPQSAAGKSAISKKVQKKRSKKAKPSASTRKPKAPAQGASQGAAATADAVPPATPATKKKAGVFKQSRKKSLASAISEPTRE